jgi:protein-S-isoprenylcysteine O-methyltransferase Ste14
MRLLHAFVGFVLFFELPIPVYWLILHPFRSFWRTRIRAAFWIAGLTAWTGGALALWFSRNALLSPNPPSPHVLAAGIALVAIEAYLFFRVEKELGGKRLVGHAELQGQGEMFSGGLYAHVRHPRYTGMFCAAAGAALLAGTQTLWLVLVVWLPFALLAIGFEEKELASRFGPSYETYRQSVPAFFPMIRKTKKPTE